MADAGNPLKALENQLAHDYKGKPPKLNLPPDDYKRGAKEQQKLDLKTFMPLGRDLLLFCKCLALQQLHLEMKEADLVNLSERLDVGAFVWVTEVPPSLEDKISKFHIHVFFKRDDAEKNWRLTAALPKESNFRGKGSDKGAEPTLVGTPSDWYQNTGAYRTPETKELVKRFAMAVLKFRADMKQVKSDMGRRYESADRQQTLTDAYESGTFYSAFEF